MQKQQSSWQQRVQSRQSSAHRRCVRGVRLTCLAARCGACVQWYPGTNCLYGKDFTVFSTLEGIVVFDKKSIKPEVRGGAAPACVSPDGTGFTAAPRPVCGLGGVSAAGDLDAWD